MSNETTTRRIDRPALVVALLLLACAAIVANDAYGQTIVATYGLGPTAVPYVISIGLAVLGLAHLIVAFKDGLPQPDQADGSAILWITIGLVGLVACIALGGGFILATALVFALTARGMGRRAFAVDFVIGIVLGLAIFLVFQKLLTLSLPDGPLERLMI